MLKPMIAATAVLAIAGSSIVYAQQRSGSRAARLVPTRVVPVRSSITSRAPTI